MKLLIISIALFLINFGQSDDLCSIEIDREQLLESQIILSCPDFKNGEAFVIKGFSIKFPGQPTEVIKGSSLNDSSRAYLSALQVDESITIFDIKEAETQSGKIEGKIPAFKIKLKQ